jgi:hypothetical protein
MGNFVATLAFNFRLKLRHKKGNESRAHHEI